MTWDNNVQAIQASAIPAGFAIIKPVGPNPFPKLRRCVSVVEFAHADGRVRWRCLAQVPVTRTCPDRRGREGGGELGRRPNPVPRV